MSVCHLLVYTVHVKITRTVMLVLVAMATLEQIVERVNNFQLDKSTIKLKCFWEVFRIVDDALFPVGFANWYI